MKVKRNDVYIASIYQQMGEVSILEKKDQLVINIGYSFVPFDELKSGKDFVYLERLVQKVGAHNCTITNVDSRLLSTSHNSHSQTRFVSDLKRYYQPSQEELVGFIELATEQKKLNRKNASNITAGR